MVDFKELKRLLIFLAPDRCQSDIIDIIVDMANG